ncbi:MAG: response regulator, partial [Gammaproteobacteria bacterium]|nr:response regulator [Gammaproteobacteria bacterium]
MTDTKKIWIIDDDDSIRWVLQKALEQAGMEVTSFNKADGILDRLTHSEPDTIITDVRMPGMDGLELLSALSES